MFDSDKRYMTEAGDEPMCNTSANRTFEDVAKAFLSRRGLLAGAGAFALASAFATGARAHEASAAEVKTPSKLLGFEPVAPGVEDGVRVPKGYRTQVIAAWGEPISGTCLHSRRQRPGPTRRSRSACTTTACTSSRSRAARRGPSRPEPRIRRAALPACRHGGRRVRFRGRADRRAARAMPTHVRKEINAHGVSASSASKQADGTWAVRRRTRSTAASRRSPRWSFAGPVRRQRLPQDQVQPGRHARRAARSTTAPTA